MTVRAVAKYRDSSSRTSSGSRDSDNVVNPTRSPNRTEVTRRSATRAETSLWRPFGGIGGTTAPGAGVPHSMQNLPVTAAPQPTQDAACGAPHSGQNFAVSGALAPHEVQDGTEDPLSPKRLTARA